MTRSDKRLAYVHRKSVYFHCETAMLLAYLGDQSLTWWEISGYRLLTSGLVKEFQMKNIKKKNFNVKIFSLGQIFTLLLERCN